MEQNFVSFMMDCFIVLIWILVFAVAPVVFFKILSRDLG